MIEIDIPGFGNVQIKHIVLDYNGTIAIDGKILPGVEDLLKALTKKTKVHVITADTFGTVREQLKDVTCEIVVIPQKEQHLEKLNYIKKTGFNETVCFGNGRNDRLMLKMAVIGIAVLQAEGAAYESISAADILVNKISDGLALFLKPLRLKATLRS